MNKGRPRNLLFFLSPRFVDFDTYLPTAMELAAARPEWRIRFVVFHEQNYRAILANHTMMAGLDHCGSIHSLGGGDGGRMVKIWRRLRGFAAIAGWILRHGQPVLFSSRSFSNSPYVLFAILARLRGGNSYLLWKRRSTDEVHKIMFLRRKKQFTETFPGFNLHAVRRCGLLAAPLSGGFRNWSLIPARAVSPLNQIEKILTPVLGPLMAFRMLVILERRPNQA